MQLVLGRPINNPARAWSTLPLAASLIVEVSLFCNSSATTPRSLEPHHRRRFLLPQSLQFQPVLECLPPPIASPPSFTSQDSFHFSHL